MANTLYKIALTNVDFDNTYENNIRFNSREEQENYFDVAGLFENAIDVNWRKNNLLSTQVVYRHSTQTNVDAMLYNYCIIKNGREPLVGPNLNDLKYLYYFITDVTFDVGGQVILDLELDVIQTFYIDLVFEDCFIERAHLNRWKKDGEKYKFDVDINNSPLFQREEIKDIPQYIDKIEKCELVYDTFGLAPVVNGINGWLRDNVKAWLYIYIQPVESLKLNSDSIVSPPLSFYQSTTAFTINKIKQPYVPLCVPLYSGGKRLYLKNGNNKYKVCTDGIDSLFKLNANLDGYKLTLKLSNLAPLNAKEYDTSMYSVDANGDMVFNCTVDRDKVYFFDEGLFGLLPESFAGETNALFWLQYQNVKPIEIRSPLIFNTLYPIGKSKDDIKLNTNESEYNPKSFNGDISKLYLSNGVQKLELDILKLQDSYDKGLGKFVYIEPLSPDITRSYFAFKPGSSDDIVSVFDNQFLSCTGCVGVMDNSLPLAKDQLGIYLANNKNFFMQKGLQLANDFGTSILGGLSKKKSDKIKGVGGIKDVYVDAVNTAYTLDNMENAPDQIENISSNAILMDSINNCSLYAYTTTAVGNDRKVYNDFCRLYGYAYNRIDNPKNFENVRVSFNYIKCQLTGIKVYRQVQIDFVHKIIHYGLPERARIKLRDIFNKGITLWNLSDQPLFNANNKNYERYLDEQV